MRILALGTGLFPDRETVAAALDARAGDDTTTEDLTGLAPDDDAAWDRVARAILDADRVVTL
mgnify:CR=1 FL=1